MVPEFMAHKLYDACTGKKQMLIVPGANHGESMVFDPEGCHQAIHSFFRI